MIFGRAFTILLLSFLTSCTTLSEASVLLGKEYYNLGNSYFELKKFDQAARAYESALRYAPELKIAALNLARTRAESGNTTGALALLEPLASADPENLVVAQQLAWLQYKAGQKDKAAASWQALAQKLPADPKTQFNTGVALMAVEKKDEALAPLDLWYSLDGKNPAGVLLLADLVAAKGDTVKAGSLYRAGAALSAERSPTQRLLALGEARMLEEQKRYGEAVDAWKTALDLPAPAGKDSGQGEAWFHLGRLQLLEIEDYNAGVKALVEAWKAGYTKPEDWKVLLDNPDLKVRNALSTDLKAAGVVW